MMAFEEKEDISANGILKIELDDKHVKSRAPIIEQERAAAIRDLLRTNAFKLIGGTSLPPYYVRIGIQDYRLIIHVRDSNRVELEPITLALKPFRRLVRDYFMICSSFMEAYGLGQRAKVEALDMARRGIHNEGALLLKDYLGDKIQMDIRTARGFFTLICVLHI